VLCSYDANGTPDPVIAGVWETHPEVVADDSWTSSDRYEDPDHVLRRVTPAPAPLTGLRPIPFGRGTEELREQLARELAADRMSEAQSLDLLLAATELANNAMQHGGGIREVRAGRVRGRFVCEIVDRGDGFDDPAAGYLAPREGIGAGLWVARQLTWRIEFFRSPAGFTSRIWF
jgi:anti-sigma regulatory factor (Ser/Thr protein kinase)